ncbi:protein of unknown function [Rhodovastum atsumiense]|nr:protein of unknown function [Rhodovastum atsumiense]
MPWWNSSVGFLAGCIAKCNQEPQSWIEVSVLSLPGVALGRQGEYGSAHARDVFAGFIPTPPMTRLSSAMAGVAPLSWHVPILDGAYSHGTSNRSGHFRFRLTVQCGRRGDRRRDYRHLGCLRSGPARRARRALRKGADRRRAVEP